MAVFYLDYVGLAKALRGIKNKLDTKTNNADIGISNGVITVNSNSLIPVTNVTWDTLTHALKQTIGGVAVNIVTGGANGIAFLDPNGKVDASLMPAYVDDIIDGMLNGSEGEASATWKSSTGTTHNFTVGEIVEDDDHAQHIFYIVKTAYTGNTIDTTKCEVLPVFLDMTGTKGKIYFDVISGSSYRWSGSAYVEIISHAGSTDEVPEGSTNLYFTNARALEALATALAGKADIHGNSSNYFAAQNILASGGVMSGVSNQYPAGRAELMDNGIVRGEKVSTPELGNRVPGQDDPEAILKVNNANSSLIESGQQANVAFIIEDDDVENPGLITGLTTSEIYDAFAAAGIMLGANKTEGMAILDGTTPNVNE